MLDFLLDPEKLSGLFSEAMQHQIFQFTVAFTIAAWIHSGRVKKEIKNQFGSLVTALSGLGEKLENRIEGVEQDVKEIKQKLRGAENEKISGN